MILPMMGFLMTLAVAGVAWFLASGAIGRFRPLRPFALVPFGAALLAFGACWSLAISLEAMLGEAAGGAGFFVGYVAGGLAGASLGYAVAQRARRPLAR